MAVYKSEFLNVFPTEIFELFTFKKTYLHEVLLLLISNKSTV